ncbi:MAG: hypothetical protein A2445_05675 [Candidatus Jacksonbacteria bacterium RIFOXYC2_FULL_44_29]|nr:MAG: hypothetical protein UW45_C0008G0017 [Parcubacteria group bacterium GW2011_GWC2_44_22]OGY76003.1 MAG: hypothetical protein A2240_05520 [Candidatus Jacksonbacteria bacterium RIFOXYA2_FULL_43_12]OGY76769.1 MAG: hypothetical protein A2295_00320 [Candidatus Jacksonbacteria bacterium RIFOXYB2_FULL_44_15]OGY79176.1 MAG: hypothetical protein A2445_05675 [Candidatus Jacksonbacteria bacterium RIFOXYC2_FULL_44_29]OGY82105.1 MAG: hypothetical protein A2550_00205 [Candidatus Jacksonbacteria bacteri
MNSTPHQIVKTRRTEHSRKAQGHSGRVFVNFKKETKEIEIVQELIRQDQLTKPNSGITISDINYYKI